MIPRRSGSQFTKQSGHTGTIQFTFGHLDQCGMDAHQVSLFIVKDILRVINGRLKSISITQTFTTSEALQRHGMQNLNVFDA